MPDLKQTITDIIRKEFAERHPWGPDLPYPFGEYVARIAPVAADAVVAALPQPDTIDRIRALTDREACYHFNDGRFVAVEDILAAIDAGAAK